MFSSALKSLTSNISSNYTIAPNPSSTSGPWRIFDAKKKTTGKAASVFVFDRRSLEPGGAGGGGSLSSSRGGNVSLKRAHDEVVERLKKEASSLARLRHPSILELQEPVEETRTGGLIFVTEPVTASLAGLLEEKDEQERSGGVGSRGSKYVVEDERGGKRRREVEVDELEIQKGLLQIGKGLEFLHESAGLVHANLTPDAIFVNAKSDWKISGLGFASPQENAVSATASSMTPIQLSEVLNYDPRLPKSVQLNLDYTSPDFVIDNNINPGADMFSLGLIIIALYNSPHKSPLETGSSISQFKRIFSNQSTIPTKNNNFLITQPLPKDIQSTLLPRLITRRPAQRLGARDLQQAQYFDNILVSTIRFLDSLPAKTANEKSQFMRGLPRILPQFPKTVLEKKVLPALLEEMKDHDLLSLILQNVFKVIALAANSQRAFSEKVVPRLREVFLTPTGHGKHKELERDTSKEAGLVILFENMAAVTNSCSGKEFKDDILPIIIYGLDSPTHSVVDKALQTLPIILPVLDFSTIKNDLFPVVAVVFSKTTSMAIKIRGLEAINVLCGGAQEAKGMADGLGELASKSKNTPSSSAVLDKYTVQEKVVPLLKAIKTKEPAVMTAALEVFKQVGKVADVTFLALEALPTLWQFSLGPLLNVEQFKDFMTLIKSMSTKIEQERIRKLQELSSASNSRFSESGANGWGSGVGGEDNFESLVTGRKSGNQIEDDSWGDAWDTEAAPNTTTTGTRFGQSSRNSNQQATFSWSSTKPTMSANTTPANRANARPSGGLAPPNVISRSVTPDQNMSSYAALTPSSQTFAPKPAPASTTMNSWAQPVQAQYSSNHNKTSSNSNFDWSALNNSSSNNPWASNSLDAAFGSSNSALSNSFSNLNMNGGSSSQQQGPSQRPLDKYESLL